ncbi:unnamed protein product, partial [Sphacelaria rigidula]
SSLATQAAAAVFEMRSTAVPDPGMTLEECEQRALLELGEQVCSTGKEGTVGAGDTRDEEEGAGVGVPAATADDKTDKTRPDLVVKSSTLEENYAGTSESLLATQAAIAMSEMDSAAVPDPGITMEECEQRAPLELGEQACSIGKEGTVGAGDTRDEEDG